MYCNINVSQIRYMAYRGFIIEVFSLFSFPPFVKLNFTHGVFRFFKSSNGTGLPVGVETIFFPVVVGKVVTRLNDISNAEIAVFSNCH